MLKRNVGTPDRVIRIVLGIALLAFTFFGSGPLRWLGLLGLVSLGTAVLGSCPVYSLFGISTCPLTRKP